MAENDDFDNNMRLLESKESIDNQSNSIFVKSFEYENFNYTEILKNKKLLKIFFNSSEEAIEIPTDTIKKILSKIETENDNLEIMYSKYVTALILDNDNSLNKEDLLAPDENIGVLDTVFVQLLDQTKKYHISFPNNENNIRQGLLYDINKNKIPIQSNSIKKICSFLNKNIYDISDYINIILLNMNEEISSNLIFKNKILDKYSQQPSDLNDFTGVKLFNLNLDISLKNRPTQLYKIDALFNNALNHIEDQLERVLERDIDDQSEDNGEFNIPKINIIQEMNDPNLKEDEEFYKNGHRRYKCGNELCAQCGIF